MQSYILAADDEPNVVRLMQVWLERAGYQVETANNGLEALAKIRTKRPDLLITDVMMPEMDGFDLLASVRGDPALADLPIIMLVPTPDVINGDDPEHVFLDIGSGMGADCYLIKPFHPDTLVKDVERFVPRPVSKT